MAYISYRIGNLQYQAEAKQLAFNTDTCTEAELINRCKELHFSEENTITQTVLAGEQINIGNVYRKYCKRICGLKTFNPSTTDIT